MKSLPATSKIKIAERMSPRPSSEELANFREMRIDMHRVMTGLHNAGFDGALLPDHVPGDQKNAAYTIGYMRAIRRQVCGAD